MRDPLIEARQVEKFYKHEGANRIQVIAPTDLAISSDEILAVLGPSGSGNWNCPMARSGWYGTPWSPSLDDGFF